MYSHSIQGLNSGQTSEDDSLGEGGVVDSFVVDKGGNGQPDANL